MDPRKQECFGRYLYGAGYFSRDDNTLGVVTGQRTPPHFCSRCPKQTRCEQRHEVRVRQTQPAEVERYDALVREARARGVPELLAKRVLGERNLDPFAAAAVDNFNRGHGDRGQIDGLLVHSDADPRRR